jgi:chromosome segregation ATPase
MKNILQNLLVVLSFGLCALCAWQWYVQAQLHLQGESLQQTLLKQAEDIQAQTNRIKSMDAEIAGLSTHIEELKATVLSNKLVSVKQDHEIFMLHGTAGVLSNEIDQYKEVVDKMEAKLKSAAEGINRQNEAIVKIAKDRDDAIARANDTMKDRNAVVEKYNSLVLRWNQLQTNAPAQPEKQ